MSSIRLGSQGYRMVGFIVELDAFFSISWRNSGQSINLSIN